MKGICNSKKSVTAPFPGQDFFVLDVRLNLSGERAPFTNFHRLVY